MKTFSIQDLIAFLERNPEKEFKYTCCREGCLLAQFFFSEGVAFDYSRSATWQAVDNRGGAVAEIEGAFREMALCEIHLCNSRGSDILAELKKKIEDGSLYA